MKATKTDRSLMALRCHDREGRPCDTGEVLAQVGKMTVLAICGGKWAKVYDSGLETVGVLMFCGESRAVEIVLDPWDTYTVRRVRLVNRGAEAGSIVVESEVSDVYCDNLSEVAYSASCWK